MFICQVLCTGIQGKYHLSELKSLIVIWGCFGRCFRVFWGCWEGYIWHDCTMLTDCYYPNYSEIRGNSHLFLKNPLAKVGSSAKFGVAVFKACILNYPGGPSAKVGSSAKFGVAVFKGIYAPFTEGSICQSMFICQVLCTGIQGKYHLSELKSLIVIWGVFWQVFQGVLRGLHLTWLYNAYCLLP